MIYQLKVTLNDVKPAIWRQLRVPDQMTLRELHSVLQVAMGWENAHMHQFTVGGQTYGEPDPMVSDTKADSKATLGSVVDKGEGFVYTYDFGDSWEHEVVVEDVHDDDGGPLLQCIDGKRACPPEDCGGPWGYGDLLSILENPKHKEHEERREWLGGEYDPDRFDKDQVNVRLAKMGDGLREKLRLRALKEAGRKRSRPSRSQERR